MKHGVHYIVALAATLPLSNQINAQTLPEAAKIVAYREPELAAARYDTASSFHQFQSTKTQRKPHIYADGSAGYSARDRSVDGLVTSNGDALFQRNVGVTLRQLLFDAGESRHQVRQAESEWHAQQFLERSMIEARIVDLAEVYLELFRVRQQITEAGRNIDSHRKIASRLSAGDSLGNKPEISLVQGRLGSATRDLAQQQMVLRQAEYRFLRLVGHSPKNLKFPKIPTIPKSSKTTDLSGNWDYMAAVKGVEIVEHRLQSIKAKNAPKVYLDAGYSRGVDSAGIRGNDNEARALLTFNWDLYKGGEKKQLKYREVNQLAKFNQLVRAADEERKYQNELLWNERTNATHSISALNGYKNQMTSATKGYEERFETVGKETLLGILDLWNETYRANSQLIDAKFERDTSAYRILGNQGRLAELLGVDFDFKTKSDDVVLVDPIPVSLKADSILDAVSYAEPVGHRNKVFNFKARETNKPFQGRQNKIWKQHGTNSNNASNVDSRRLLRKR